VAEHGLQVGTPEIASVGPITFGPDGILFVADNARAAIVAIDVADDGDAGEAEAFELEHLDTKVAAYLGCEVDDVSVRDLAVHPTSHRVYLSVMRGRGNDAIPVIVRIDHRTGELSDLPLTDVATSSITLGDAIPADDERTDVQFADPPEGEEVEIRGHVLRFARPPARSATVTDMAYLDGELVVAGMSNEEFSSTLRRIPFPFRDEVADTSLEIFHVSHGKWETASPIRTFVPYDHGRSVLASYTCTPLVHFPLADLAPGDKATGRTVAELGAMNQPLDMVRFTQQGDEYLLVAHSTHPLMKIACADIDAQEALTEPQEPRGVPRETVDVPGVKRLANLNGEYVLALQRDEDGSRHLRSLKTASL
jgi:hypothetical protein